MDLLFLSEPSLHSSAMILTDRSGLNISSAWQHSVCSPMSEISDLTLKIDRHGITVANPQTREQITYIKEGSVLVAYDLLLERLETYNTHFLAQAWSAVHAEARRIGWLRS